MRQRITIVGAVAASLLLAACGTGGEPEVSALEIDEADDGAAASDGEDGGAETSGSDTDQASDPVEVPEDGVDDAASSATSSPEPDPERVDDPCAEHQGREADAFLDLVAPVDQQVVSGSVELVGCANVFEANVVWTLLDGDGRTLEEGFTTATCGTGCVGEFRETIVLDVAAGEPVYLQVYSPNPGDSGPDQLALTEVLLVIDG